MLQPKTDNLETSYPMAPIVTIRSCFSTRNGTPRQPLIVPLARAQLMFDTARVPPASLEGLEEYSHCWIIYVFHLNTDLEKLWKDPSRSKLKAKEAERKIPINYASRYSSKAGGLQKSAYLPFKVNSSGVMPIIFSTSSLALPGTLARFTGLNETLLLDPDDVSEQLKRQGASIPFVLSRISVLGSVFLAVLAAGPAVVEQTTHLTAFRGFAGTSVLILVGCATDTARKVQAEIISQKYKNIEFYEIDKDMTL
ncbi:hypothetical protein OSB04_020911 [Centaurea solstitialis]|uniref:TsaA-like domain-containing protein n=1 Tax=Centaurea solstitialis TaxID=347529 RepID=A0AA38STK1_9ASTR|nr:hypothetical protein OSB04_020911 [Centaurea solstitialis]